MPPFTIAVVVALVPVTVAETLDTGVKVTTAPELVAVPPAAFIAAAIAVAVLVSHEFPSLTHAIRPYKRSLMILPYLELFWLL